jgi:hypothetical protein
VRLRDAFGLELLGAARHALTVVHDDGA